MTDHLAPRPELWRLDPDRLHLNHGSYGAVPVRTQRLLAGLRAETDANPMSCFRSAGTRVVPDRLEEIKAEITLTGFDDRTFVRLSGHAYNTPREWKLLAERLPTLLD